MAVIKTGKERKGRNAVKKAAGAQKNKKGNQSKKSPDGPVQKESGSKPARQETVKREAVKQQHSKLKEQAGSVRQFFLGTWQELKKVHWPTRREVVIYTGVVLAVVTIVMIIIWIADSIFSQILGLIIA